MKLQTAKTIQAAFALAGSLAVIVIPLYKFGWLDDWRINIGVVLGMFLIAGLFWLRHHLKMRRHQAEFRELWESRRRLQKQSESSDQD